MTFPHVCHAQNGAILHSYLTETVEADYYNVTSSKHQPRKLLASKIKEDAAVVHFLQPSVYINHIY